MQKFKTVFRNPLTWGVIFTLGYLIILAAHPTEAFFGVPGQWTWSGRPPAPATWPRWWPAIAVLCVIALMSLLLDQRWEDLHKKQRAIALGFLTLAIPALQISLTYIHYRHPIEYYLYRTIGLHNGFWQAAISIDSIRDYVRTYPAQMKAAENVFGHLTTHPPGNILYVWLWRQIFESLPNIAHTIAHWLRGYNCADFGFVTLSDAQIAATLGQMLVPLWSGLTVLPLYAWARQLGGARTGWRTAALFTLVPTLSLFTMRWDTLYPFLAATAFALLHRGLKKNAPGMWFASGLTVSVASFCSFGNAPLALATALYAAGYLWLKKPSQILRAWRGWLTLILGGYSVWGIFHILAGVSVWDLLSITSEIQAHLRETYTYGLWLFYNAYDILTFAGVPVGVLFVAEAAHAWEAVWRRVENKQLLPALTVSGILTVVNLAGVSPGEVGRLWMLWVTGIVLAAVLWLQRQDARAQRWGYALLTGMMALQCLWMTLFLRVSPTGMPSYQPRTPAMTTPSPKYPLAISFGETIQLVGYDVHPENLRPGGDVEVTLYWRAKSRPDLQYTVFVHMVDEANGLIAQHDSMPANASLPTSCWFPQETVPDSHILSVPDETPPGDYRFHVGLYYWPTMERLPIVQGATGDSFTLPNTLSVEE